MEPQSPAIEAQPPARRGRGRAIVISLVLLLLIAFGTAGAVVARYRPLERGNSSGTPGISVPFQDVTKDSGQQTRVVTYVQDASLAVDFSVENEGRWSVSIVDLPGQIGREYPYGLFAVTEIRRGVRGRCCVETEPFSPFTLGPHEQRLIRLIGVFKGCGRFESGSSVVLDSIKVRFRFLKLTRTATIGTGLPIEIHIPDGYDCPESRIQPRR